MVRSDRVLDTRNGTGTNTGRLEPGETLSVGVPDASKAGAAAVVLNVTAANGASPGYVTAWSCDQPMPATSVLSFAGGRAVANLVVVEVGAEGVCFASSAAVDLIADMAGWFAGGTRPVPQRLVDTRAERAFLPANVERRIPAVTAAGLAPEASSAVVNVTVTQPQADGFVTVYPCGTSPNASTANFRRGEDVANLAFVALDRGDVCVWSSVATHVVVDSFGEMSATGDLRAQSPSRILDTRSAAEWPYGPPQSTSKVTLHVAGRGGVPNDAAAALLTITAVDGRGDGYVTVWPCDEEMPPTSTLNLWHNVVRSNLALVDLADADGTVCLQAWTSNHSPIDLLVDAVGWVTGGPARPEPPARHVPPAPPTAGVGTGAVGQATTSGGSAPTFDQVGPRGALRDMSGSALPCGTYTSVRFTSPVELSPCAYTFVDADIPKIVSRHAGYVGAGSTVSLSHSIVRTGVWFEDGGHDGWRAEWTLFDGGPAQAVRPSGPGTITIADSLLLTHGTPVNDPNIHTEAMQALKGAAVNATRVGFSVEPRWSGSFTPVTGVVNLSETSSSSILVDCEFGYYRHPGSWSQGGGYFSVYPGQATFVSPRIHAAPDAAWYQGRPPAKLSNAVYG